MAAAALILPFDAKAAMQCVAYAREVTGLDLRGDAWKWWEAAHGVYDRGRAPRDGAVLVFNRQGRMVYGHVAVVRKLINSRKVLIDHANWAPLRTSGRGKIVEAVPMIDVSPKNDWSQVRVWYPPAASFGDRVYKTQGFIYNPNEYRPKPVPAALSGEAAATAAAPETPAAALVEPVAEKPAAPAMAAPAPARTAEPKRFDAGSWAEQA
ncbi:CHAP domain-containing protein [Magnetospirillum sp. SS-4]|uniref:CHAP domain-containing protein n=1 Tax=Magnetospirillum sp. SS-4 TaxID=2681465 RepID=UPI0020C275CF|nr:CHAP domain-containing protein [Magnetospirillum sp. SS-4]